MDTQKLAFMLRTCISHKSLNQGKLLHQKIITIGLQNDTSLCKSLISLYLSTHLFESARLVLQNIDNPLDISLWNDIMTVYSRKQMYKETLQLFERLLLFPYPKPDKCTYPSVIKACGGLRWAKQGRKIHNHVIKAGFGLNVVVTSALVSMYAKCKLFDSAIQLFNEISDRDVASWNAVISCYYQDGQPEKALGLFEEMRRCSFEPDAVTYTTVFSACARLLALEVGKKIHDQLMRSGFKMDAFLSSAIVDMYGKCGCLDMAREIFEQIPLKSVVTWNSMIAGYALNGDSNSCLELFLRMDRDGVKPTSTTLTSLLTACSRSADMLQGKFIHGYILRNKIQPDIFIDSSFIDLYFKCGSVQSAERVFNRIPKTNVVSWNVMISGYVMAGSYFQALDIFNDMRFAGVRPDAVTFISVLPACSQLAALEPGKEIHNYIIENKLESNEIVMGALLDMYAKCGAVDNARQVFDCLPVRDFVSWTSMIMAYGSHGQALEALELFHKMRESGGNPDCVTFLAVISACSHAGLVDEGCYNFNLMTVEYGIKPTVEHYSCLIDLLGRAGRLHEAYDILQNTPSIKADVGMLAALFSACNLHGNLELGVKVGRLLVEKDPDDPSTYVALSNLYASAQKWEEVSNIRAKMKEKGLKKNPGRSWIEAEKQIHSSINSLLKINHT